jgi:hypothetical protein
MKPEDAVNKIQGCGKNDLIGLWNTILLKKAWDWDPGWAFQYLIVRAFELEGAEVKYPFPVYLEKTKIEELDGYIYLKEYNIHIIIESKDQEEPQNITPIAKLRNQLMRRPAGTIGSIFSTSGFTWPSLLLGQFLAPHTILFWEKEEIEYCLKNSLFTRGVMIKYKYSIENGISNFVIDKAIINEK